MFTFYGLADYSMQEIIEFYPSRAEAEQALADVLEDEPGWADIVGIERVELSGGPPSSN
jgi:hypothetical protein